MHRDPGTLEYNLPAYGLIRAQLFFHTRTLYRFLETLGYVQLLKTTNQLGVLRHRFPGAHHTRFEYLAAQLAIASDLCTTDEIPSDELPLSNNRRQFEDVALRSKSPSGGELIQTLSILSNIGHLPGTLISEAALLYFFRKNSNPNSAFRKGLPKKARPLFDQVSEQFNVYDFHYLLALWKLSRHRKRTRGTEISNYANEVILSYLGEGATSDTLERIWGLYRGIRRTCYLALDSLYTGVPFSLDVSTIFQSLWEYMRQFNLPRAEFPHALAQLDEVMEEEIYLHPQSLLLGSQAAEIFSERLKKHANKLDTITGLKALLCAARGLPDPTSKLRLFELDLESSDLDWATHKAVGLHYHFQAREPPSSLQNPIRFQEEERAAVGRRSTRVASFWNPGGDRFRLAYCLLSGLNRRVEIEAARRVGFEAGQRHRGILEDDLVEPHSEDNVDNIRSLLDFLLRAYIGWEYAYRIRDGPLFPPDGPYVLTRGSTQAGRHLSQYRAEDRIAERFSEDSVTEIEVLEKSLRSVDYQGLVLAFAGSTVVLDGESGQDIAEFDGLAFLLSDANLSGELLLTEAKNLYDGGAGEAAQELAKKREALDLDLSPTESKRITDIGAYSLMEPDLGEL